VGFAGALRAPLRVGDLTLPCEVIDSSGQRFAVDPNMHGQLNRALCAPFNVHQGALAGVDHVVDEVARKGTLARGFDVDVVDMESAAIARVARDAGLPFVVLRVVCDGPLQGIPRCIEGAADARGRVIVARLASALALRPWELLGLLRLGAATVRASRVLERALCTVFDDARDAQR
jgi:adenosylhomocysteine nucleosidase